MVEHEDLIYASATHSHACQVRQGESETLGRVNFSNKKITANFE